MNVAKVVATQERGYIQVSHNGAPSEIIGRLVIIQDGNGIALQEDLVSRDSQLP